MRLHFAADDQRDDDHEAEGLQAKKQSESWELGEL